MSQYYRHLIESGLLLDTYPNAAVAYSLRKLRSAYTGPCISVRRSIDSTLLDIGFDNNGSVDTQAIQDWCGYNLGNWSQNFENATWAKTGINVTGTPPYIDVAVAPDGTTTADKMIETLGSSTHRTTKGFTYTVGNTYNTSVYLKAGERRYAQLLMSVGVANQTMNVDLLTGTIFSNSFTDARLTSVGSGWYRFDANLTPAVTQSATLLISMQATASGPYNYVGDGTSGIYVWGCQTSLGFGVKTYQITTALIGGTGNISTWYDQSGNNNYASQGTLNSQPLILSNSQFYYDPSNGKIASFWTGISKFFSVTSQVANFLQITGQYLHSHVASRVTGTNYLIGLSSATSNLTLLYWRSDFQVSTALGGAVIHGTVSTLGSYLFTTGRNAANLVEVEYNGNSLTPQTETATTYSVNRWGTYTAPTSTGYYQEAVLWKQSPGTIKTGVIQNTNTYYGIY